MLIRFWFCTAASYDSLSGASHDFSKAFGVGATQSQNKVSATAASSEYLRKVLVIQKVMLKGDQGSLIHIEVEQIQESKCWKSFIVGISGS